MNFLIDMPLSPMLAAWLRDQGHDAVHAAELGLHRAPDFDILARAKQEGRTIVTADLDYPRLLARARNTDPSLILRPPTSRKASSSRTVIACVGGDCRLADRVDRRALTR